jgi:hypothetical protein
MDVFTRLRPCWKRETPCAEYYDGCWTLTDRGCYGRGVGCVVGIDLVGRLDVADGDIVVIWTVPGIDHVLVCKFPGINLMPIYTSP